MKQLLRQYVLYRCKPGADAFALGMNDVLNMFQIVSANAMAYMPLFVYATTPLTSAAFKRLCVTQRSADGSNRAAAENDTLYAWEVFLLNVEELTSTVTLGDLLMFVTGADSIPPLGFQHPITIEFYDMESARHYPTASTCELQLWLPRGIQDPVLLQELMEDAVLGAHGFGKC